MSAFKSCSKCGTRRPNDSQHFVPARDCKEGLSRVCRKCRRKYHRAWRDTDERRAERAAYHERTYVPADQTAKRAARQQREPHRTRAKAMRSGFRDRTRELGLPEADPLLTLDYLESWLRRETSCPCCGVTFQLIPSVPGQKADASPSLDRLRPSLGYVLGNVALICWRCNNLKRDATPEELERVARWMRIMLEPQSPGQAAG